MSHWEGFDAVTVFKDAFNIFESIEAEYAGGTLGGEAGDPRMRIPQLSILKNLDHKLFNNCFYGFKKSIDFEYETA